MDDIKINKDYSSNRPYVFFIKNKMEFLGKNTISLDKIISNNYKIKISELDKINDSTNIIIDKSNQEKNSGFVTSIDEIKVMVKEIVSESYKELKNISFSYETLKDDSFYFQSFFKLDSLLKKDINYTIMVNIDVFKRECPKKAVKSILAHELSHTLDYETKGKIGILKIGLDILSDEKRDIYEHSTDIRAISRGYGDGLIEYRNWVYKNIPKESIIQKKKTYYQPEEIKYIQEAFINAEKIGKKKELLYKWLNCPPMSIKKIKKDLEYFLL